MNAVAFLSAGHNTRSRWGDLPAWWELASLRINQLVAALLLLACSPLMLVVALLIWQRDGAPVLFAHYRVGRNGKLFRCLK
ncbi:MAG TPA: sugar transferase, partial [Chloroflexota bacterium]|nr:sugar transferase [Chloroflexota bacterium]